MAPERLAGQCDARGDIYSLGPVLYEQLCLRPAFDAADRQALLEQIARHTPVPPRQINLHVPRDLETIVVKAISRQPADRYASAAELAQDLRRFLEDKPIHSPPVGAGEHLAPRCRRDTVTRATLWSHGGTGHFAVDITPAGYEQAVMEGIDGSRQVGYAWDDFKTHAILWRLTRESAVSLHPTRNPEFYKYSWGQEERHLRPCEPPMRQLEVRRVLACGTAKVNL